MKVEIHINGRLMVELQPETEIERLVLAEMAKRAGKGQPVQFGEGSTNQEYLVSVEKS